MDGYTQRNIEDEACESSVIVVTNIRVHQQTVVVHVLTALGEWRGRREEEEEEEEAGRGKKKGKGKE